MKITPQEAEMVAFLRKLWEKDEDAYLEIEKSKHLWLGTMVFLGEEYESRGESAHSLLMKFEKKIHDKN